MWVRNSILIGEIYSNVGGCAYEPIKPTPDNPPVMHTHTHTYTHTHIHPYLNKNMLRAFPKALKLISEADENLISTILFPQSFHIKMNFLTQPNPTRPEISI